MDNWFSKFLEVPKRRELNIKRRGFVSQRNVNLRFVFHKQEYMFFVREVIVFISIMCCS